MSGLDQPSRGEFSLGDDAAARLGSGDVLVFDGVLGDVRARAVAAAIRRHAEAHLAPAAIGKGGERTVTRAVRGDRTTWLERGADEPALAPLWTLFERVREEVRECCWLALDDMEVQVAHYPPDGAHYDRHRDAFASGGRRRATAIYYLNPDWRVGHGGELVAETPAGDRVIEPVLDRLVVFLAALVPHEVRPCHADRWAVAAWLLGPGG